SRRQRRLAPYPAPYTAPAANPAPPRRDAAGFELGFIALRPGLFHPELGAGQCPTHAFGTADGRLRPRYPAGGGGYQFRRPAPHHLAAPSHLAPHRGRTADRV